MKVDYEYEQYPPLAAGHLAIGLPCGLCHGVFVVGDVLTLLPEQPVVLGEEGELVKVKVAGVPVHWACAEQTRQADIRLSARQDEAVKRAVDKLRALYPAAKDAWDFPEVVFEQHRAELWRELASIAEEEREAAARRPCSHTRGLRSSS